VVVSTLSTGARVGLPAFRPHPRWRGGHRMTLYAWARPRVFPRLPAPEAVYFDTADDARVLAHCHWQPERTSAPALLLLHGLEGSSSAHYMRGIADKAWAAGFNVVRLNQRNCGGTEALSRGLYHSGLTDDPLFVLRHLSDDLGIAQVVVAGYSLGGNLTLKLAGDAGDTPPPALKAVCAVSPTMDLALCVDALERRPNVLYQWNFMRNLRGRMRLKARLFPDVYDPRKLAGVWTVRRFDDVFTAPLSGFGTAERYYREACSYRVIDRIRIPTLIVSARNDPFVPPEQFERPMVTGNPAIHVLLTDDGGHCAFVGEPEGDDDGYWAESTVVRWARAHVTLPALTR
jgi:predicted alpha/beta-fold hydrolase